MYTDQVFEELRMGKRKDVGEIRAGLVIRWEHDARGFPALLVQTEPHDTTEDKQKAHELVRQVALAQVAGSAAAAPAGDPIPFEAAVADFLANSNHLKGRSKAAYRTALINVALPFFGADTPLGRITQARFAQFAAHVDSMAGKAVTTKEGYLNAVSALGAWHRARGADVPEWKRGTLLTRDSRPADRKRDLLTLDQLGIFFANAAGYRGTQPAKFWVTVLAAFTGCRVEEIAQVDVGTDLHQHVDSGVWYLEINECDPHHPTMVRMKSLKNKAAWRVLPIHSALVKIGAIEYLQSQAAAPRRRPFELQWNPLVQQHQHRGVKVDSMKWAHQITKWGKAELNAMVKQGRIKLAGTETYFHSMRHAFITHLAKRGLSEAERAPLTGHTVGGINSEVYAKLRNDPVHLSGIVEEHLSAYVDVLNAALEMGIAPARRGLAGRPPKTGA